MAYKTFTVTVVSTGGGNKYFIDGVQQATVALARGVTYRFDQSDSSNATHPLVLALDSGNSTLYTTGVTTAGTPGSGGAYTEIAVASSAPALLYYNCSNHAGMGGVANVNSTTFGALTWGANSWNSANNTISVTGIGASLSLGDETAQANSDAAVTGIALTGSVNDIADIVIATTGDPAGISISANLGTADAGPDAMVTGLSAASMSLGTVDAFNLEGWGRQQWNTFAWGISGSLITTGVSATANLGSIASITADANVIPTGIAMTASQGNEDIQIATEVFLQNNPLPSISANLGTADAGPDAMLTGISFSATVGSVDAYNQTGWGRQGWNENAWGVEGQFVDIVLTGIAASFNVGTLAATGTGEVTLTGIGFTADEGIVDPGPDATITGIGFSAALGLGTVTAGAETGVTGIAMTANLGTVIGDANTISSPTGIAFTATLSEESVVGEATALVTGIGLTMSINSVNALIWNEVNTGSAPLDPPGWVEVPTRAA